MIDVEAKRIIDESTAAHTSCSSSSKEQLEALAQALLEKEVLNENDLKGILGERPYQAAHLRPPRQRRGRAGQ